jgi:UDP-N-acetyl-D-galactosamine dehydrogenase
MVSFVIEPVEPSIPEPVEPSIPEPVEGVEPRVNPTEVKHEYGIDVINGGAKPVLEDYAAIILAIAHQEFRSWAIQKSDCQVVFDVKSVLPKEKVDARL